MTPRIILRKLRKIAEEITENIDSPNHGGCCVIAAAVGATLERHGIWVECVTRTGTYYNTPAEARENLGGRDMEDWEENGVSFHHVAVRFRLNGRVYTWDSDTGPVAWVTLFSQDRLRAGPVGSGLTVDEAQHLADTGDWNCMFDRDQIPFIHEIIDHHFPKGNDNA